jgi:hypothetical protein
MPTFKIINNSMIMIHLEQLDEDVWGDESDEKTIVISTSYLAGYEMNKTSKTITLYFTIKGLYNFTIDFQRGGIDKKQSKSDYEDAIMYLTGGEGF